MPVRKGMKRGTRDKPNVEPPVAGAGAGLGVGLEARLPNMEFAC